MIDDEQEDRQGWYSLIEDLWIAVCAVICCVFAAGLAGLAYGYWRMT
jgi:hypothetical protein